MPTAIFSAMPSDDGDKLRQKRKGPHPPAHLPGFLRPRCGRQYQLPHHRFCLKVDRESHRRRNGRVRRSHHGDRLCQKKKGPLTRLAAELQDAPSRVTMTPPTGVFLDQAGRRINDRTKRSLDVQGVEGALAPARPAPFEALMTTLSEVACTPTPFGAVLKTARQFSE